jgi:hypothetical protein
MRPLAGSAIFIRRMEIELMIMQKNRKSRHDAEADQHKTNKRQAMLFIFKQIHIRHIKSESDKRPEKIKTVLRFGLLVVLA